MLLLQDLVVLRSIKSFTISYLGGKAMVGVEVEDCYAIPLSCPAIHYASGLQAEESLPGSMTIRMVRSDLEGGG